MPLKEIEQPFDLLFDACALARLGKSSARFDSFDFENVFRSRLARTLDVQDSGRHGRVVAFKKKIHPFCLTSMERLL